MWEEENFTLRAANTKCLEPGELRQCCAAGHDSEGLGTKQVFFSLINGLKPCVTPHL